MRLRQSGKSTATSPEKEIVFYAYACEPRAVRGHDFEELELMARLFGEGADTVLELSGWTRLCKAEHGAERTGAEIIYNLARGKCAVAAPPLAAADKYILAPREVQLRCTFDKGHELKGHDTAAASIECVLTESGLLQIIGLPAVVAADAQPFALVAACPRERDTGRARALFAALIAQADSKRSRMCTVM